MKKKYSDKFTGIREMVKQCGGKDIPKALRVTISGIYSLAIEGRIDLYFSCPSIPMTDGAYFFEEGEWRGYLNADKGEMRGAGFLPLYQGDVMELNARKVCTVTKCKKDDMANSTNVSFFDKKADAIQLKYGDVYLHEGDIERIVTGEIYQPIKKQELAPHRPSHRKAIEYFAKLYLEKNPLVESWDDLSNEKREAIYKKIEKMIHAAPEVYKLHVAGEKNDPVEYRTIKLHAGRYITNNQ